GVVLAVAANTVLKDHDPSAHAEMNALRKAAKKLGTHDLSGCILYATGHPCPMCLAAIIWANIKTVYYGCEAHQAQHIGFRDDLIYRFIEEKRSDKSVLQLIQLGQQEVKALYEAYQGMQHTLY
ncbi:MAG: nucleoside deaminase, partial [Sphaerochaetaceae bacterium]